MNNKIIIRETTIEDLENIQSLWNDGEVMYYVGFPDGLGVTIESLKSNWYPKMNQDDKMRHYSIYHEQVGYCGESFYKITEGNLGMLDIKLFPKARGKGIAYQGLYHAIKNAFENGKAKAVFVDPHKDNKKALKLYQKLGFKEYPHPDKEVGNNHYYLELSMEDFLKLK